MILRALYTCQQRPSYFLMLYWVRMATCAQCGGMGGTSLHCKRRLSHLNLHHRLQPTIASNQTRSRERDQERIQAVPGTSSTASSPTDRNTATAMLVSPHPACQWPRIPPKLRQARHIPKAHASFEPELDRSWSSSHTPTRMVIHFHPLHFVFRQQKTEFIQSQLQNLTSISTPSPWCASQTQQRCLD
jgi:hypothetical protein